MTEYMLPARPGWEPLRVSILPSSGMDSRVGALIGFVVVEDRIRAIVVLEDGFVGVLNRDEFTVDWRYDAESDGWVDVNAPRAGETDQEV